MNPQEFDPKAKALVDLYEAAKTDEAKRERLLQSPLDALADLGITVDPVLQDAVTRGLQVAAFAYTPPSELESAVSLRAVSIDF